MFVGPWSALLTITLQWEDDPVKNFLLPWMQSIEVVEAVRKSDTTGHITYRFPAKHLYSNPSGNVHGGAQAAFFDVGTTWLLFLIQKPGFWERMGITRSLNCTYLRPAPEGEMLRLECEIVHAGKSLCALKAVLKTDKDGKVCTTCEHNKYNVDLHSKL